MPLSLRSIALSSAAMAASPLVDGPVTAVPPGADLADPVVTPALEFVAVPVPVVDPDELAVPALLVPGAGGAASLAELPAPLGSLPELFRPPAFAGPEGTPLTPALPAPGEPAFGEPTALPLPADGPLAFCADAPAAPARMAIATIDAVADIFIFAIGNLPLQFNIGA
jgi:hypothetical protein